MELTEDSFRRNRLRYLILEGGRTVLRDCFDKKIASLPATSLTTYLIDNKQDILRLKKRNIITKEQLDVLYPTSGDSSSEMYDVTLLVVLLRNFPGGKPAYDPIWDKTNKPLASDLSEEADIVRLRDFRNEIVHYLKDSGPTDTEFDTIWKNITEVLVRLGNGIPDVKSRLQKLRTECIDKEYEEQMTKQLQRWDEQDIAYRDMIIKAVQDNGLFEAAMRRSKKELMDVLGERFVETKAFKRAQQMLKDEGLIVIKGAQGEGKTTISKRLVNNPDTCLKITSTEEWKFCENERVKVALVDDMFGSTMFDKTECKKWYKLLHGMIDDVKNKRLKVIITSRSYILEAVLENMHVSHLISEENTLTISSKELETDEKKDILESHVLLNKRPVDDSFVDKCIKSSNKPSAYMIGFPECASLFCKEIKLFTEKEAFKFFECPMVHIIKCLENIFKEKAALLAFFVLWAQKLQQLKLKDIEQGVKSTPKSVLCAIEDFQYHPYDSLKTVRETLLRHRNYIQFSEENEIFRFNHRVLSDAVGLVVYKKNRTALLKYCDAPFIKRYISIECPVEKTDVGITVMPERYDQLCLRIGMLILRDTGEKMCPSDEIQQPSAEQYLNCSLLLHPAFGRDEFCAAFFNTMAQEQKLKFLTAPVSTIQASLVAFEDILKEEIFETEIGVLGYTLKQSLDGLALACFREMKSLITCPKIETDAVKNRMQTDISMTMLLATLLGKKNLIDFLEKETAIKIADNQVLALLLEKCRKFVKDYRRGDKSLLIFFVEGKNTDGVERILSSSYLQDDELNYQSKGTKETALHVACKLGHPEIVAQLLNKNPDLQKRNSKQKCPIHVAALAGKIDIVKLLLQHDIKQADYPVDLKEGMSMKLFHIAVIKEQEELINRLLQLKVSPTCIDGNNKTPLVCALQAYPGKWRMANQLIDESIKQNAHNIRDRDGNKALHVIKKLATLKSESEVSEYEAVKSKLESAEKSSPDKQDKTAYQFAKEAF